MRMNINYKRMAIVNFVLILAFLIGFMLWKIDSKNKVNEEKSKRHYVKIDELKTKIKFESIDESTFFYLNWEILQKWEIKKVRN